MKAYYNMKKNFINQAKSQKIIMFSSVLGFEYAFPSIFEKFKFQGPEKPSVKLPTACFGKPAF